MGNGIPNTWDNLKTIWEMKVKMKETEMLGLKYIAVIIIDIYLRNKSIFSILSTLEEVYDKWTDIQGVGE